MKSKQREHVGNYKFFYISNLSCRLNYLVCWLHANSFHYNYYLTCLCNDGMKRQTNGTNIKRLDVTMRASGASELESFDILQSKNCRFLLYFDVLKIIFRKSGGWIFVQAIPPPSKVGDAYPPAPGFTPVELNIVKINRCEGL